MTPTATYPRWTSLEFLAFCHPSIREIYDYWNAKRGARAMPRRSDIDPAEITALLPSLMLVDVVSREPLSLRYRLVGTREVEARGNDPTGRTVAEAFYGKSLAETLANYQAVVAGCRPVFDPDDKASPHTRLSERGSIFLPLSEDGATVDKVMVYTAYKPY